MLSCEMCESNTFTPLGVLGDTAHLCCRQCGWVQSAPVADLDDEVFAED